MRPIRSSIINGYKPPKALISSKLEAKKLKLHIKNPSGHFHNYRMAGNIGVELYLVVGEMKPVSANFNPPTLNQPIFAYNILSPNIIPANISGHTV